MRPLLLGALTVLAAACAPPPPPAPPPAGGCREACPPPPAAPAPVAAPGPSAPPAPPAEPAPAPAGHPANTTAWRAVFHLSDPGRPAIARGLGNALNAVRALGDAPIRFVLVVHGPALGWLRRAEPDNLAEPVAQLLATGHVELEVCARTLEENHWKLSDIVPGAVTVPIGTVEVLRLQHLGFAYFKP